MWKYILEPGTPQLTI